MKERRWDWFNLVALICMVLITVSVLRREFLPRGSRPPAAAKPIAVPSWPTIQSVGHRIGGDSALVTLVSFSDFQCPACRTLALRAWPAVKQRFGDSVALVYRHWPLDFHEYAYDAAVAANCAAKQGRFSEMHDVLFAQQNQIGEKSFIDFALEAGIKDTAVYASCIALPQSKAEVDADVEAAQEVGGAGTPTLIINGLRYDLKADPRWLPSLVDSLLQPMREASGR